MTSKKGFTIIEVLIVLAIAGVIMLVVFLTVPQLQRYSRNTQRKSDIVKLLGAVSEYESNNLGTLPASGQFGTAFSNNIQLGYFDMSNITWNRTSSPRANQYYYGVYDPVLNEGVVDAAIIENYLKCGTDASGRQAGVITNATARDVVALYRLEDSANIPVHVLQCTEL
jgi:prepilin-type N-terminal cleavage/methylation domain-containing protein